MLSLLTTMRKSAPGLYGARSYTLPARLCKASTSQTAESCESLVFRLSSAQVAGKTTVKKEESRGCVDDVMCTKRETVTASRSLVVLALRHDLMPRSVGECRSRLIPIPQSLSKRPSAVRRCERTTERAASRISDQGSLGLPARRVGRNLIA
jgi:hypothetical protein